ncbi:Protein of unknown function [Bacillus wiedmannii]|uniref:Uncharacterized protein n=1 Tax=Bacillus wiedmannii TaxID=1890302 RepID=A0A1C4BC93_9BACI|nr:Protein of unknown function [Bacillus wiedmannii]SCN05806.1 Protein of unknown function [Bacillus wiedmannii]
MVLLEDLHFILHSPTN